MNLELTMEQKMIQKMVREFTENEVKPIAAETDRTAQYPAETIDQLFRYGVMGMCVPKEYGGAGADVLSAAPVRMYYPRRLRWKSFLNTARPQAIS